MKIEGLTKDLIYQCRAAGKPVTEALANFVIQTLYNEENGEFYLENIDNLQQEELEKNMQIIRVAAAEKLIDNYDSIDLKTIELQIQYESKFMQLETKRQERLKEQSVSTGKLIDDVVNVEVKNSKDFEGLSQLYKKIFNFLVQKNREVVLDESTLESQINQFNIEKEVAAALESVIPRAALGPFISLNPSEKVSQLVELSHLVVGIRLFNKEIGKGGISLASLEDVIEEYSDSLLQQIKDQALVIVEQCDAYTLFFLHLEKLDQNFDTQELDHYKGELTFLRQFLSYVLSLQEDIEESESNIETSKQRYQKEISELKLLLGNKSSAPKEQVYPKFSALAQAYQQLLEESRIYTQRLQLNRQLHDQKDKVRLSLSPAILQQAKEIEIGQTEMDGDQQSHEAWNAKGVKKIMPSQTLDFMQTPLDFLGFCVYSIAQKDGLLIPGKPSFGVYEFKGFHNVFYETSMIEKFFSNPDKVLQDAILCSKKHPELIRLLRLEDQFPQLKLYPLQSETALEHQQVFSTKLMVDKDTSTPLHFHEKNIDPSYCWNEWELRKKALQMANIRKKQTKAVQTILSSYKIDVETQVYLKKDQSTNTTKNSGTNPTKPKNYIIGLRDKRVQLI